MHREFHHSSCLLYKRTTKILNENEDKKTDLPPCPIYLGPAHYGTDDLERQRDLYIAGLQLLSRLLSVQLLSCLYLPDRTTSRKHNIFDAAQKEDGSIYVLCNSTTSKTFEGSDGEVALITMQTADTMEAGDYPIALKNIVLAKSDASTIKVAEVVSLLTIEDYTPGDANGDNEINGGDITAISNYLLGYPNSAFEAKGADFNEDHEINGADITAVSNYLNSVIK